MADSSHCAGVLIVSDDTEFARTVAARWQLEPRATGITVATSDIWGPSVAIGYDLVIVGPLADGKAASVLSAVCVSTSLAVVHVVADEKEIPFLQTQHPHLLVIPRQDGWINTLILVSCEALRRVDAVSRLQRTERVAHQCQQDAALGRYWLEMRPSVNDALTSVLGNADLLLLEAAQWPEQNREQLRTVQAMALRLHQAMQRFSSLAAERNTSETSSHHETEVFSASAAARF